MARAKKGIARDAVFVISIKDRRSHVVLMRFTEANYYNDNYYTLRFDAFYRYVFGDGPCGDWDPDTVAALEVVRAWRTRYQDDIERLPDSLIETYDVAAKNPDMQPSDVAMVAFAVFGFLL